MKLTETQRRKIEEAGRITAEIKKTIFEDCGFLQIRDALEENGLDRHLPIELTSTEVAIITPSGILMQIRSTDRGQLGMWGGVLKRGEEPKAGAIREVYEETKLMLTENQLEPAGIDEHFHEYENGDKAIFNAYRFVVHLDYVPEIKTTDDESLGGALVTHTILSHQQDFIKQLLGEI